VYRQRTLRPAWRGQTAWRARAPNARWACARRLLESYSPAAMADAFTAVYEDVIRTPDGSDAMTLKHQRCMEQKQADAA